MGKILHRVVRQKEEVMVSIVAGSSVVTKDLYKDIKRNKDIVRIRCAYICQKRKLLLLSDRVAQLKLLMVQLRSLRSRAAMYTGATTQVDREKAADADVILSTWSMSKEGLDIPALDTLIMASPRCDVEQAIGRILRFHPLKQVPVVVDIVDHSESSKRSFAQRAWYYKQQKFQYSMHENIEKKTKSKHDLFLNRG